MLPTFIVIGAAKSGTTSLHRYLRAHPDVYMPERKELRFFPIEENWRLGVAWYEAHFDAAGSAIARGEVSGCYTLHPAMRGVPDRMADLVPDVRLVYVVRQPIERMCAHYMEHFATHQSDMSLVDALYSDPRYIPGSMYAMQIELFLERFERDQLLVVTSEALRDRRKETLAKIFEFIGVQPHWDPTMRVEHYQTLEKRVPRAGVKKVLDSALFQRIYRSLPVVGSGLGMKVLHRSVARSDLDLPEEVRADLRAAVAPDVRRLYRYVDGPFDGWGIA